MRDNSYLAILLLYFTSWGGSAFAQTTTPSSFASTPFDVIIIGGGTAGLVVANRLSATSLRVGVIDAGTFNASGDPFIDVPSNPNIFAGQPNSSLLFNPKYDWMLPTVPQVYADGKAHIYSRGKVLGGSSAINNMVWSRGARAEYDLWGTTFGNGNDWTFNAMLPYFERSETWSPPPSGNAALIPGTTPSPALAAVHGKSGPILARYNTFFTGLERPTTEASETLGFPLNPNPDAGNSTYLPLNGIASSIDPRTQKRSYAASGYYTDDVRKRENLSVLLGSVVSRIIWDNSTIGSKAVKAVGVEYISGGQTFVAKVSKEVIVAAGALKTPQVFELSGVGNATLLKSLNIPVVVDLPQVGENLIEQPMANIDFQVKPGVLTLDQLLFNQTYVNQQKALYISVQKGAFTVGATALGSFPLQKIVSPDRFKQMRTALDAEISTKTSSSLQKAQFNAIKKLIDPGVNGYASAGVIPRGGIAGPSTPGVSYLSLVIILLHQFSRGSVHVNSTDPNAIPVIDPKLLFFDWDTSVMGATAQFCRQLAQAKPLSDIVASVHVPGSNVTTDAEWESYIKNNLSAFSHPIGTTPMTSRELGGVVDNRLRVYGLQNVRIVDASVMPLSAGVPVQATVYMVAEKAADILKQDLLKRQS